MNGETVRRWAVDVLVAGRLAVGLVRGAPADVGWACRASGGPWVHRVLGAPLLVRHGWACLVGADESRVVRGIVRTFRGAP